MNMGRAPGHSNFANSDYSGVVQMQMPMRQPSAKQSKSGKPKVDNFMQPSDDDHL